jgi:uncharacterized protein YdcH (DUF465 family)
MSFECKLCSKWNNYFTEFQQDIKTLEEENSKLRSLFEKSEREKSILIQKNLTLKGFQDKYLSCLTQQVELEKSTKCTCPVCTR